MMGKPNGGMMIYEKGSVVSFTPCEPRSVRVQLRNGGLLRQSTITIVGYGVVVTGRDDMTVVRTVVSAMMLSADGSLTPVLGLFNVGEGIISGVVGKDV
jgi:hypothetical protein